MKKIIAAVISAAVFASLSAEQLLPVCAVSPHDYLIVTDYGANGFDTLDDTAAIQHALDYACLNVSEMCTVTVPEGTYYISDELTIHSNTILSLADGAEIVRLNPKVPMLTSADDSGCQSGGYTHAENITVTGGEWDGGEFTSASAMLFSINHASNITVSDCYIHNFTDTHAVIFNACSDVTIENVDFADYIRSEENTASDWYQEALHLDYSAAAQKIVGRAEPLDDTPCQNVTVRGCTFTNVAAGVGTHHDYDGLYENNMSITDCTFEDVSYACVNAYGFTDMNISGNTAVNVLSFARLVKCSGTVSDNNISCLKSADETAHQLRISNSQVTVKSNVMTGSTAGGIAVLNNSDVTAADNTVKAVKGSGITVSSDSKLTSSGNTLSKCRKYGVYADGNSQVIMSGDKLLSSSLSAVYLNSAKSAKISDCTVTSPQAQGIYSKNTVLSVVRCKISDTGGDGIYVVSGKCTLKSNSVSKCSSRGIAVKNAVINIASNKIYSNSADAIKLVGSVKGTLKSNLIGAGGLSASSSVSISNQKNKYRFSESTVKLSKKTVKYTGNPIKPSVKVTFAGKTLRRDIDYKVSYISNVSRGKATVKITGIGKYSGEKTANFTIK